MATAEYDYTHEQGQGQEISADDFVITAPLVSTQSADAIEAENSFEDIPSGTHRLVVVGFLGAPKAERKELYIDNRRVAIDTHSVVVKFALPDDRGKQVTDYFLLPPADPDQYRAFCLGSKEPNSKKGGFFWNKYHHFIQRLFGIVIPEGQPHPEHTKALRNWKEREVIATVQAGKPFEKKKVDTDTGEEVAEQRPGRNEIKLYSYRATNEAQASYQRPAQRMAAQPTATTRAPGAPTAPRPTAAPQPAPPTIAQLNQALEEAIGREDFAGAKAIKDQINAMKAAAGGATTPANVAGRGPVAPPQTRQPATDAAQAAKMASLANV